MPPSQNEALLVLAARTRVGAQNGLLVRESLRGLRPLRKEEILMYTKCTHCGKGSTNQLQGSKCVHCGHGTMESPPEEKRK